MNLFRNIKKEIKNNYGSLFICLLNYQTCKRAPNEIIFQVFQNMKQPKKNIKDVNQLVNE